MIYFEQSRNCKLGFWFLFVGILIAICKARTERIRFVCKQRFRDTAYELYLMHLNICECFSICQQFKWVFHAMQTIVIPFFHPYFDFRGERRVGDHVLLRRKWPVKLARIDRNFWMITFHLISNEVITSI